MWIVRISLFDPSATAYPVVVCASRKEARMEARRMKAMFQPEWGTEILSGVSLSSCMYTCGILLRKPVSSAEIIFHLQDLLPWCAPLARRHILKALVNICDYWRVRELLPPQSSLTIPIKWLPNE